ncbi:MAG: aldose 1-epimerase family protein [Kiritimatiellae bacterium]|nr:aldose 1-epimerase family protein [Kiritimatiellia bacterium]
MDFVLENALVRATVSDLGAELRSAVRFGPDGPVECAWQGDPAFWAGRAPLAFPVCGRLPGGNDGRYSWKGREYKMRNHGFLRGKTFDADRIAADAVRFSLRDDAETRAIYPFCFETSVEVFLVGDTLRWFARVRNAGDGEMPFSFGFHPGFNVPLGGGGAFEDWKIVFDKPCEPERVVFAPSCLRTGEFVPFPLENGRELPLRHGLFDGDAIFLRNAAKSATLCSPASRHFVRLAASESLPFVGFWHPGHTEAPFVCIEPWSGLPSLDGKPEDLATKEFCARPAPGESVAFRLDMQFGLS